MNYFFKTVLLLISLLLFACGNEEVVENSVDVKVEKPNNSEADLTDNAKLMILCIAKKSLFFNGSIISKNQFEDKVKVFFDQTLENIEIFNVMVFYEDVSPSAYTSYITTIKKVYENFRDRKTQEKLGKRYDELLAHEKYSIPYRISFNEIERKFMTESQSTSGLKCH